MTQTYEQMNKWAKQNEMKISEATQVAIDRQIILQKMKGNDTFKDVWLGNGWLSKDKDGKITFTPTKQLPYQEDKMKDYIVKCSSIVVKEYTVKAKSEEDARDKWAESRFISCEETDEMSTQIEEVWEQEDE